MDADRERRERELTEDADEAIADRTVIKLGPEDSVVFATAILNPPAPNENLRALAQRYREVIGK